jgi:aminoglycoside phosphotransferase (APT) family kinase protein
VRAGRINTHYRVRLDGLDGAWVVRIFGRDPEACGREARLLERVAHTVPVPDLAHADEAGAEACLGRPYLIARWVEGQHLALALEDTTPDAQGALGRSVGAALAAIHSHEFPASGFLGPDLSLRAFSADGGTALSYVRRWLAGRAGERLGPSLSERLATLLEAALPGLDDGRGAHLAHSDFNPTNVLVQAGAVTAVLDWEWAYAGGPWSDLGNLFRIDRAPSPAFEHAFRSGYDARAARPLPADWKRRARIEDTLSHLEFLSQEEDRPLTQQAARARIERTLDDQTPDSGYLAAHE